MTEPITWWHAIILGLTQGLTEFIPVSSSGHLNITHWLFGQSRELTYDVFLHLGTLFALVFYFRKDWVELLKNPEQKRLRNLIFLACVPAVIIGVALRDMQDGILADVRFNAFMMILMGAVLLGADHIGRKERKVESTKTSDALFIGFAQALALFPGVSRSGATLTAGLLRGFERADAARFSFLMSMPITLGAVGFEVFNAIRKDEFASVHATPMVILLGVAVSAISGFWAINFMLQYLRTRGMMLFFVWRLVVGLAVFALYPILGPPKHSEPPAEPQEISVTMTQPTVDFSISPADRSSSAASESKPLAR